VKAAACYAGVGERTLRKWLKHGLRSIKSPTGTILIKLDWIDSFLEGFEVDTKSDIQKIVNSALEGVL
jgi:hypothetical protein